jgi:hypothetical protein
MIRSIFVTGGIALLALVSVGSLASARMAALDVGDAGALATNRDRIDVAPRYSPAMPIPVPCGLTGSSALHICIAVAQRG